MRALQIGHQGCDVKKWQYFLCGQGYCEVIADGIFGRITDLSTRDFQKHHGLVDDGLVGTYTLSVAGSLGFELVKNPPNEDPLGLHWPPNNGLKPLPQSGYRNKFGAFSFQLKPGPNPQGEIVVTCNWQAENLVYIQTPLLSQLPPYHASRIRVHKRVADQFNRLFDQWKKAGLSSFLQTYDGGYYPRMMRGSKTNLSAHSYGIAIDINAFWNPIGKIPPKAGDKGSVRTLVEIANENGFIWGGHFSRHDGMHFEIAEIKN